MGEVDREDVKQGTKAGEGGGKEGRRGRAGRRHGLRE